MGFASGLIRFARPRTPARRTLRARSAGTATRPASVLGWCTKSCSRQPRCPERQRRGAQGISRLRPRLRDRGAASACLREADRSPADIASCARGQTQFGFNFFRATGESNCLSSSEGRMRVCLPRDHRPTGRSILDQLICGAHARPIAGRPRIGAAHATAWRRRHEGQWRSKPRPCNARH